MKRIDPQIFNFTPEQLSKLQLGYYSDKYFVRTQEILLYDNYHPKVLMQIFTRKDAIVCGIDEVIALLKLTLKDDFNKLTIKALYDGDNIKPWETIMTIEGDYSLFAHLETVYLGILARRTKVATNVKNVVNAAKGKPILFFPARFDHWTLQTGDGYAAFISGALGSSTDANCDWWGSKSIGTIPHGLIAAYNGDTAKAALKFDEFMPEDINRVVLVDFDNDCIKTSIEVVDAFCEKFRLIKHIQYKSMYDYSEVVGTGKYKIWGVRFDTSNLLRDKSVTPISEDSLGVCPELCFKARKEFDAIGLQHLKIVVSGGFNEAKISKFMKLDVPVDVFAAGSSLFEDNFDFTADIVRVDNKACAKIGRQYNENERLEVVN
jgi:nicotinate phosphoribosyltransferase